MGAGERCETLGSETKDFVTHSTTSDMNFIVILVLLSSLLSPHPHPAPTAPSQVSWGRWEVAQVHDVTEFLA